MMSAEIMAVIDSTYASECITITSASHKMTRMIFALVKLFHNVLISTGKSSSCSRD